MILLAVDPSINRAGVALFRDGRLIAAGAVTDPFGSGAVSDLIRARGVADRIRDWFTAQQCVQLTADVLAVEWPLVLAATKSKGDHNDLLGLGAVCGALSTLVAAADTEIRPYTPAEWIGQVKKTVRVGNKERLPHVGEESRDTPRARLIRRRLEGAELDVWGTIRYHDTVDAIGIGLHHLGRLAPRRVYAGATR